MTHYLSYLINQFPYLGLFALLILGGMGLPFPEDATLVLCGFLISTEVVKPFPALLVVYVGLLIADFFIFLVGNKYGSAVINHPVFHKFISAQRLKFVEDQFGKKGIWLILAGRHLAVLRAQIFLAAGVMKMSPLKFVAADAVSAVFTMTLMVGAGYVGGNSLEIIKKDISRVGNAAVVLLTTALAVYLLFRYFRDLRK
jgi:membrane protein DedA with SNARE-associated domain